MENGIYNVYSRVNAVHKHIGYIIILVRKRLSGPQYIYEWRERQNRALGY